MSFSLYSVFHLNLAYSAIREDQRAEVVEKCYWPLLETIRSESWPCGIEFSGWTLERIREIDPSWIDALIELTNQKLVEVVGSGYSQIIGPLVPARVNKENLRLGWKIYNELLGVVPRLSLIPEQAYSAGYAALLGDFGLEGFVMEWNNPRSAHPEWPAELLYRPQNVITASGAQLPVLWNHSITFQKFQRYAQGELGMDDVLRWIGGHQKEVPDGCFSLYGNDAEVFDFRPGRYMSEEPIQEEGEWWRIRRLVQALREEPRFQFLLPSQVLATYSREESEAIKIESIEQPVPVKKQQKYNIVRWAVTGRDDFNINSKCHQILQALEARGSVSDAEWANLLYLWSSDFRTHISEERWQHFLELLDHTLETLETEREAKNRLPASAIEIRRERPTTPLQVHADERFISIESDRVSCQLNLRRGLAIQSWVDRQVSRDPVFGTFPIGSFESIRLGADWYSGNLTLHPPGLPQITDLSAVQPVLEIEGQELRASIELETPLGRITKLVEINAEDARVHLRWAMQTLPSQASLRFGFLTLFHFGASADDFSFSTYLGGEAPETFALSGSSFNHGQVFSNSISASSVVGSTEGTVEVSDGSRTVRVDLDPDTRGAACMLSVQRDIPQDLIRLWFSAQEIDDTSKARPFAREFGITLGTFRP